MDLIYELRRGLLDMKRRGLLGEAHCPDDNEWIDGMLSRLKEADKAGMVVVKLVRCSLGLG